MVRMKQAVNARKKRHSILEGVSGYRDQRSRLCRKAKEQITHSGVYAFCDRHARRGDFRRLWIQHINTTARVEGLTYNRFTQGLGLAGVEIDRRIFVELVINKPADFKALVEVARKAPPEDVSTPKAWVTNTAGRQPRWHSIVESSPHALNRLVTKIRRSGRPLV